MKQNPLLLRSELTDSVYVVTRYQRHDNGTVEALEKHDVTDQFVAVALEFSEDWWNTQTERAGNESHRDVRSGSREGVRRDLVQCPARCTW